MQKYKVAVIGCGGRSQAHIKAYQHIEAAQVVACCDLNRKRADERAAEFKLKAYADAGEMLAREKPDLVHVITAPNVRLELLTLVSDAGVPACTVEKPLATGVADWRALCDLERKTRTKIAVCHQFRWQSHLAKCREALKTMGPVKFLEFSAGMNISGQGTHILNYGMSLNGDAPVARVFGAASGTSEFDTMHPAPDQTAGYLTFANGVRALWNNGPTAPRCGDPSTTWQHVRVAAFADRGRITWEEFGAWEIVGAGREERGAYGGMDTWMANNVLAQANFHKAMFRWLEGGEPAGTNFKQSLHEWQVVLALYASALWRKPVDLAGFNPPDDLFDQLFKALRVS